MVDGLTANPVIAGMKSLITADVELQASNMFMSSANTKSIAKVQVDMTTGDKLAEEGAKAVFG